MTWLELLVFVTALWRLASLITSERGPFDIFVIIRTKAGVIHDEDGQVEAIGPGSIPYLFTCLWCCSMLLALPYSALIYFFKETMFVISLPFAASALAIAFDRITGRNG